MILLLDVGKFEYRAFCDDFLVLNESIINASTDKEAISIWLEKGVKVLAIKRVNEEKAKDLAIAKKYIVRVNDHNSTEYRYYHILQIPLLNVDLNPLLKGARI